MLDVWAVADWSVLYVLVKSCVSYCVVYVVKGSLNVADGVGDTVPMIYRPSKGHFELR